MSTPLEVTSVKTPVLSRRAELLLKLTTSFLSFVLFIGLIEGAAYLWERSQANGLYAWELVASRRIDLVEYSQPGAGYTLMQPGSQYEWQEIPVDINSNGLRNPELAYEKSANTYRILNLGDSIAMGWGVRMEETYGRQLEDMLNTSDADQQYEVINAGVPGWNPANELAFLEAEGLKYEPDLVLLDLTIVNDIYGRSALEKQDRPALIEWLRANTYFWPFLTVQMRWIEARSQDRERIDVIDPPKEASSYFPVDSAHPRWEEVWSWIESMNALAAQNGAEFGLILFPLEFQVLDENYSTLPQELIRQKAEAAGIPVLDLLPVYQEACHQKEDGCRLEDRYLFADVWMHPSAYGHEITAVEVKSFLQEAFNLKPGS
ncbi:MAG: SGNH/GDSL hydrolase family protein [Anaerolineaceae bacterium]|nr:SGNH/GDSL hydrolase family protein [Anaerolineaceae bacterium]